MILYTVFFNHKFSVRWYTMRFHHPVQLFTMSMDCKRSNNRAARCHGLLLTSHGKSKNPSPHAQSVQRLSWQYGLSFFFSYIPPSMRPRWEDVHQHALTSLFFLLQHHPIQLWPTDPGNYVLLVILSNIWYAHLSRPHFEAENARSDIDLCVVVQRKRCRVSQKHPYGPRSSGGELVRR